MRNIIRTTAPLLLIILFVYAGLSKWLTFAAFRGQLHNQSFPGSMAEVLLYTLIPVELLTAGLLAIPLTQRAGLVLSTILMAAFTGYILLVLLHFWERVPCSCGGILAGLSWTGHLVLNFCFLLLSVAALALRREPG